MELRVRQIAPIRVRTPDDESRRLALAKKFLEARVQRDVVAGPVEPRLVVDSCSWIDAGRVGAKGLATAAAEARQRRVHAHGAAAFRSRQRG